MKLYDQGVYGIDAGYVREGLCAIYLVVQEGRVAIVETGTVHSLPRVAAALVSLGLGFDAVDYILPTHVHLDHAGGAGALLARCPQAQLVVHPRGARHLIDPGKLIAGSIAVYGEAAFRDLYGDIVPADPARVIEATDGFRIDWRGRTLEFLDTPGHARHHYCVFDHTSRGIFSGDCFGISYREFDVEGRPFIYPTTTPVQFEPAAAHATLDRLMATAPDRVFLTHFGEVTELQRLVADLHLLLDDFVMIAEQAQEPDRHASIRAGLSECLLGRLREHGCSLPDNEVLTLLENDIELNAQGLCVWLDGR